MRKLLIIFCFQAFLPQDHTYAAEKKTVYVYQDEGVDEESLTHTLATLKILLAQHYLIKTIDADKVKEGAWMEEAALFVMPGGADLPYVKKLNGLGNQNIKQYVKRGGSFLGICAGAYYASSYVEFDQKGPLEVLGDRELKFFSGKAIGPVLAPYDYRTYRGSRAAKILTVFPHLAEVVVYYNGGGFFEKAEIFANTKILAVYENQLPAIIKITYGQGKVILSGVHVECDSDWLQAKDPDLKKIIKPLEVSRDLRIILLKKIFQILGISVKMGILK